MYAKLRHGGREIIINDVEIVAKKESGAPGKVVLTGPDSFQIECQDAVINIVDAMDEFYNNYEGSAIADYLGIKGGDILNGENLVFKRA